MTDLAPLDSAVLPSGLRSRFMHDINGLRMHVLEAGFESPGRRVSCCCMAFRSWPGPGGR